MLFDAHKDKGRRE